MAVIAILPFLNPEQILFMMNFDVLDDLAHRLAEFLSPERMQQPRSELQTLLQQFLHSSFRSLNLVTREEFELQCAILQRTREKLENLQRALRDETNPANTQATSQPSKPETSDDVE